MAEAEHGKGVALVILGIVAIIAIVGLVLLFTGARKTATGDFVSSLPKSYGGAIVASESLESSARGTGKAGFDAQGYGSSGVMKGGKCYGDACDTTAILSDDYVTYNDADQQIPSSMSCTRLGQLSGLPQLTEPASEGKAEGYQNLPQPRQCVEVAQLVSVIDQVRPGSLGREADAYRTGDKSIGALYCCATAGFS